MIQLIEFLLGHSFTTRKIFKRTQIKKVWQPALLFGHNPYETRCEKTNGVVSKQVQHEPSCAATQDRKYKNCTIPVAKTKALISCAVTAQLICAFIFAYAKCWFSHDAAHMVFNEMYIITISIHVIFFVLNHVHLLSLFFFSRNEHKCNIIERGLICSITYFSGRLLHVRYV